MNETNANHESIRVSESKFGSVYSKEAKKKEEDCSLSLIKQNIKDSIKTFRNGSENGK